MGFPHLWKVNLATEQGGTAHWSRCHVQFSITSAARHRAQIETDITTYTYPGTQIQKNIGTYTQAVQNPILAISVTYLPPLSPVHSRKSILQNTSSSFGLQRDKSTEDENINPQQWDKQTTNIPFCFSTITSYWKASEKWVSLISPCRASKQTCRLVQANNRKLLNQSQLSVTSRAQ